MSKKDAPFNICFFLRIYGIKYENGKWITHEATFSFLIEITEARKKLNTNFEKNVTRRKSEKNKLRCYRQYLNKFNMFSKFRGMGESILGLYENFEKSDPKRF